MICVGIAGGTGSGKTALARALCSRIPGGIALIQHDAYYRDQRDLAYEARLLTNYDDPAALESDLLAWDLQALVRGESVHVPEYDFSTHLRCDTRRRVDPLPFTIVEGIHVLAEPTLRAVFHLAVFVDTPEALRLGRRLARDLAERGRSEESVRRQWRDHVAPMHAKWVEPSKAYADIIVSGEESLETTAGAVLAKIRALN